MDTRESKYSLYLNPTYPNEIKRILRKCNHKKGIYDTVVIMTLPNQLCEDICIPNAELEYMSLQQSVVPGAKYQQLSSNLIGL